MTIDPALARELTLAQWEALDEDVEGEFRDGRLEEEEMPTVLHEAIAAWLVWALRSWIAPRGGMVFGSELKLAVSARRGRKPDASVYLPGQPLPGRSLAATRRPPTIVIEILSPSPRDVRRDIVDKKKDYSVFGVRQYWIVDPEARTFEAFELGGDGRYTVVLSAADGAHGVPGCEGLVLDLDTLWASADGLPDDESG
jgi:Uma2 family endonuclease